MTETDLLDPDKIKVNLKTKRIGRKILVYKSTSSTNDVAAEYAKNRKNDGLVVFAEEQTIGRGRAGAKWHSGHGDSILCSIILVDSESSPELLPLACAVATAEAIDKPANNQAKIKWPNDIILNGKKVAGILLESYPRHTAGDDVISAKPVLSEVQVAGIHADRRTYIIGIGINCHQKRNSFPIELQSIATSIDLESQTICDRVSLAKRLLTSADHWLEVAEKNGKEVINQWRELSVQLGHRVMLLYSGRKFSGNCIGIDPEKGLILQLDTGGVRMFPAAHTTIAR
jgi:BirA family biotin operon repressor/biotin-[acetyl-CoA-carboxylase] ligase